MRVIDKSKQIKRVNPAYSDKAEAIKTAIQSCVEAGGVADFDEVRNDAGQTEENWPDGYIHQAAIDLGLDVEQ